MSTDGLNGEETVLVTLEDVKAHDSSLPVQFTIGLAAGLPQWDMFLMFTTCGVMGALVTHYANAAGPVLFGANYVSVKTWWSIGLFYTLLSYVVFTIIGIPWWSMLGIFSSL